MRPIRLHLDTSDYANMYRAPRGTPEASVRDALLEMKESGQIEIGMSYHVVFELLQRADPKFREDRIARARLLTQLCGQNSFAYPSDLGRGYDFSKEGLWVPRIYLDEIEIERLVQCVMDAIAHCPKLGRLERRTLSRRRYFVELARNNPSKFNRLTVEQWPLLFGKTFAECGDFRRYILGEESRQDANRKLSFYITDPVTVYEIWYENYGRDNPIAERRDSMAKKIMELLNELKVMLDKQAALKKDIDNELAASGEKALDAEDRKALINLRHDTANFRAEITSPEELGKHPAWIALVGEHASIIAAQIFLAFHRQKRDIKRSDAIDLIHAMYLPHTDLWRGDNDFSNLLIKNRVNLHERVVPTLADLPRRIKIEIANLSRFPQPAN